MLYGLEIQFIGSLILFVNKIFLYYNKPIGWICGIVGITLLTPMVIHFGLTTLVAYHFFLVAIMLYGFYLTTPHSHRLSKTKRLNIKKAIIGFALASCIFLALQTLQSNFTLLELGQSGTGLGGALFLAFTNPRSKFIGWCSNLISHCFAIYLMLHLPEPARVVAFFQLLSLLFAILGIIEQRKAFRSADVPT